MNTIQEFNTARLSDQKKQYASEYEKVQKTITSIKSPGQIDTARSFINIFNEKYKDDSDFPEVHYQTMYLFGLLAGVIECRFN